MYIKKTCRINDKIEIEKHYDGRFGAPGMEREPRQKKTPEEVARQNFWRRCRELRRILEINFKGGDWHAILTCRKEERPCIEQAPAVIRKFRDELRREYRKQKWEMKYVITCETGERGAVHWHVIINNEHSDTCDSAALIRRLWTLGRVYFSPMDDSRDYKLLAEYIVKETKKRMEKERTIEKLSYMPSRNLIRPEERSEKIPAKSWRKQPPVPEGWYLVQDTLVNKVNKFTGLPYQHYTLQRIRKEVKGDEDRRHLHRHKPEGTGQEAGGKVDVHYSSRNAERDCGHRGVGETGKHV